MSTTKVSNYLIGGSDRGRHPATMGSQVSVNLFTEKSGGNVYMASVPGLQKWKNVGSSNARCRGMYVAANGLAEYGGNPDMFVVFDTGVFRIQHNSTVTQIGTVNAGTDMVAFSETGGLRNMLLVADGVQLYCYNLSEGGYLQQITLPDRVTGDGSKIRPSSVSVVGGSIAVNDINTGFVYYSVPYPLNSEKREVFQMEQDSEGNWNPVYDPDNPLKVLTQEVDSVDYVFYDDYGVTQYFNAESSADSIVALKSVGERLYLFGTRSIEIWQRGSGEYETWIRTSYTTNASNGLAEQNSIAVVDSTIFYIGSGDSYAKGVMCVTGNNYTKVSDDWLEAKLLKEFSGRAIGFAYAVGSHRFYCITLPTVDETWVYDTDTKEWHQRVSRVLNTGLERSWRPMALVWFDDRFYAACNDGTVYLHTEEYYWEDFAGEGRLPVLRRRQGAVIVDEERPFVFDELSIECNVGSWENYEVEPKMLLEISKDGGNTWGNVRSVSMGKAGEYSRRVRFHHLGLNRLCVIRVTFAYPAALELTACSQRVTATGAMI